MSHEMRLLRAFIEASGFQIVEVNWSQHKVSGRIKECTWASLPQEERRQYEPMTHYSVVPNEHNG